MAPQKYDLGCLIIEKFKQYHGAINVKKAAALKTLLINQAVVRLHKRN